MSRPRGAAARRAGAAGFLLLACGVLPPGTRAQIVVGPREPHISVKGSAEVEVMPDSAEATFGIEAHDPSAARAKAAVDKAAAGILAACAALEIGREAITATDLSVSPEFADENETKQIGTLVSRSMTIRLAQIGKLDDLIRRALEAGATEIEDVTMKSSREKELRQEALARAIADARARAQFVATQFGVQLGALESASTQEGGRGVAYSAMIEHVTVRSAGSVPLVPGPIRFSEEISASFFVK